MHEVLKKIQDLGIIPVIKIDDPAKAAPLAKALKAGGLPCAEVTFRTDAAKESIERITRELPDIVIGAGTVLSTEQVDKAVAAGATYIVSPGFNPNVVAYCIKKGIPIVPGCSTPSDMERAIEAGLEVVKFFPAEESGGLGYIKSVSAPFPMLKFIPTGGINAGNLGSYLAFKPIIACGGSWMVKADLINDNRFDEITRLTREAVHTMLGFTLAHLGFNCKNEDEARGTAKLFEKLFGMQVKEGNNSIFADTYFECMKAPYLGRLGHIAIGTLSITRAAAYLERIGFAFNKESAKTNDKGELTAIYLKDEVAGFAVHLVQLK
jgi:2-dehydro-3-deoxyphosphogluconate aldolase/(4S)-4-hydroxy-2-oxoglutarate aldolase